MDMKMDKDTVLKALRRLDEEICKVDMPTVRMVMGGGSSMILAFEFNGLTNDVDAVPVNVNFDELKSISERVAKEMKLNHDWLNPYFNSFTLYLPENAKSRYVEVFKGRKLHVQSLGAEDVLIMKLMAGRTKDIVHAKHILRRGVDLEIVYRRLEEIAEKGVFTKIAEKAIYVLGVLEDQCD